MQGKAVRNILNKQELEKEFSKAASKARKMVKRKVLTESETTELSWFFEQATVGGCNCWKLLNDPKFFVMTDVTKTQTRLALRGMSKLEAMERYIQLVEVLVEKYGPHFPSTFNGSLASLDSGTGSTCCSCNPRN